MPLRTLSIPLLFAASAFAQSTSLEPLASKHFTWPDIPEEVTGDQGGERGPQFGFNLCNSTTQNQNSNCQTLLMNSLDDFCMWSSPTPDATIGDTEAREVAWCTKSGHGTRVIPPGALTGAQFLYAKNYLQVVGFLDQSMVDLDPTDAGGELDPHGADEQGNPLGGIVFTNGFGLSADKYNAIITNNTVPPQNYTQVIEWIDFIGNGMFCLKMCNPDDPSAPQLCNHIYDVIGCSYNAIADYAAINGTFQVCDSDDMTPPVVFVTDGMTTTWVQPQAGAIVPPYTTMSLASSNCHTFSSAQLYGTTTETAITTSAQLTSSTSPASSASGGGGGGTSSRSSTSGGASQTGSNSSAVSFRFDSLMPFSVSLVVMMVALIFTLSF